ncbi:TPA: hypothetical protein MI670_15225 [Klebsiella pneumoniae]|nr:hypothetical protein C2U49_23870 [Klebsiella pneumoniae]HBY7500251.1 hypothetical protein [Klebsiella pneumoniae]HBY7556781.1 hypothetical protein [Klebsiella pneumoniae]
MMSLWDALRMNMMISYQELVRTFPISPGTKPLVVIKATSGWKSCWWTFASADPTTIDSKGASAPFFI